MKKLLRWFGISLAGLLAMIVLAAIAVYLIIEYRLNRTYHIQPDALVIPSDADTIARGRHLDEAVLRCTFCHGADLGGGVVADEPGLFTINAPNLTAGGGGVSPNLSDADWVRAVRHGIGPDDKGLLFMSSDIFNHLSATDLAAIISYAKSFPPVNNQVPDSEISLLGRAVFASGQLPEKFVLTVRVIDHDVPLSTTMAPSLSADYGKYFVSIAYCVHCHGENLSGGPYPFPDPAAPNVPNLVVVKGWSEEQFQETMRTGVTPYGKQIDQEYMPWIDSTMADDELTAIWLYLQTLYQDQVGTD